MKVEVDKMQQMRNKPPFQTIPEACETTGLSMYYLRKGCKEGTVPHIKSGGKYYINVVALLKQLGAYADGYVQVPSQPENENVLSGATNT